MYVMTPDQFVNAWRKGDLRWNNTEAIELPIVISCPHCNGHIVLAETKQKEQPFAIIFGSFVLLIPKDTSAEMLEKMWNDIIRPGFFQFVEKQRAKGEDLEVKQ